MICGMGRGPENITSCWSFPLFFIMRSSLRANIHLYTNYKQKRVFAIMLEKDLKSALNTVYKQWSNFFSFLESFFHKLCNKNTGILL